MSIGKFCRMAVAGLAVSSLGTTAQAICLQPQPVRVCTEYFHSENVLVAKIVSMRRIPDTPDPNNIEGWFYKLKVEKSYRGNALPAGEIYTGNDETRVPLEVGKTYLLFVNKNQQGRPAPDVCGNTGEVDQKADALAELDRIAQAGGIGAGGSIAGQVRLPIAGSQAMSESGAPGIPITVKNYVGRDQTAITDQDGRFDIHVAAGHYSVVGTSDNWDIVPYALSYMKPNDFEIEDGGCADLMFLAQPK